MSDPILILGGYGGFGGRLARRLAVRHPVFVAGRNLNAAAAFCATTPGARPVKADRNGDLTALLARHKPALVIDAAGPFQGSDYRVPQACIAAGIPYLDLADGREFVSGVARLSATVPVIAGASSVPALSGAVVRRLAAGMERITAVEMAISASNRAAAGASVAVAILGYVGKPLSLWRGGTEATGHGWQEMRREQFALSSGESLGFRLVALADVPDLTLLPARLPSHPAVTFRAGTELAFQNRVLWLASWLVRWRLLPSLLGLAGLLRPLQRLTARWGSDRSGMVVRVFGVSSGERIERRWTLIAGNGDGPDIPTLAAAILAERILTGHVTPGARDAGQELTLADFQPAFDGLSIRHETRDIHQPPALYARVMGGRFNQLAPQVAAMHDVLRDGGAHGRAVVTRGKNRLARLIAALFGFPPAGEHAVHVAFSERDGVERWTRDFGGHRFTSELSEAGNRLVERFGPLRFAFDLESQGKRLRMVMLSWSCFRIPLPLALAPRSEAREWAEDERFHFDVPITLPLAGLIVHYRGWLIKGAANSSG